VERPDGTVRKTRRAYNIRGQAHELTFTCRHGLKMLESDRVRRWVVEAIERARAKHPFQLWAYVIMLEHMHLLIYPTDPDYDISEILKSIKQSVSRRAVAWSRKNSPEFLPRLRVEWPSGRVEHHFWQQGGGYDRNMWQPKALWASVDYIHMNPVRKGLVAQPTDWYWSSARWYAGERNGPLTIDGHPPHISMV
jgi:putative transposase